MVRSSRLTRAAAACALLLAASSCISMRWQRERRYRPIDGAELAALVPGETALADVLGAFGAPLVVREHKTDGVELAYGWSDRYDWGVDVSIPIDQYVSPSLNYDQVGAKLRGVVLLFDEGLELVSVRSGYLRDLLPGDKGVAPSVPE